MFQKRVPQEAPAKRYCKQPLGSMRRLAMPVLGRGRHVGLLPEAAVYDAEFCFVLHGNFCCLSAVNGHSFSNAGTPDSDSLHCYTAACCDVLQPCCACARPPVTPAPSLPALYASHIPCTQLSSAQKDAGPITMGSFVGGLGCHAVAGCHAVTGRKCALRHVALLLRVQGGVGALCHLSHCGKRGQTLLQPGNRMPSCRINCISMFRALRCDGRPVPQLRRQCQGRALS